MLLFDLQLNSFKSIVNRHLSFLVNPIQNRKKLKIYFQPLINFSGEAVATELCKINPLIHKYEVMHPNVIKVKI